MNKLLSYIKERKAEIIILLGLMAFAYGIFIIPSETFPNINEYDPFYHARVIKTLVQTGEIPMWDTVSYYPEGMRMRGVYPVLFHYSCAIAYWLTAFVLTGSAAYNEQLLIKVISYMVPMFGILGVAAMYLLGRELRDKKTGVIAALLLIGSSSYIYRAMYAEAEEDVAGLAWIIMSLAVYVWALKKGGWKRGLVAGAVMAICYLTTRLSIYPAVLICILLVVETLFALFNKNYELIGKYVEVIGASLLPIVIAFLLYACYVTNFVSLSFSALELLFVASFIVVEALLVAILLWKKKVSGTIRRIPKKDIYKCALGIAVLLGIIAFVFTGDKLVRTVHSLIINAISGSRGGLSATVAENHPVSFNSILAEMRWLALFFVVSMPYLGIRRLVKCRETGQFDLLPLVYIITGLSMYMAQGKLGYVFIPGMIIGVSIVLGDMYKLGERLGKWIKVAAIAVIAILLFCQIAGAIATSEQLKASYPIQPGWFMAMDYIRGLPDPDTAFLTWWDYGHWTAFLGEKHAIVDNTNADQNKVIAVATVFTEFRGDTPTVEELVRESLQKWKVTHVGVDRILLTNKWGALTFLSNRQCIPTAELDAVGLYFPALTEMSKQICGYGMTYSGDIAIANCVPKAITSNQGVQEFVECNMFQGTPIQFTKEEWLGIVSTIWPGKLLQIGTPNGVLKLRVYGQPDYKIMFFHAHGTMIEDCPSNHMYGLRIFFKDQTFQNHTIITNNLVPNQEIVIYSVDY